MPGTTMIPPDQYPADWDAHWEPPADVAYGFDLEKAEQLLDEAGYTDNDGDGIREYKGKPIKLRLWARSESLSSQSMGKFITGWFENIGLKIDFQAMTTERSRTTSTTTTPLQLRPRLRHVHLVLLGHARPGRHAGLVHHRPDRVVERPVLVERGLRRADREAVRRDGQSRRVSTMIHRLQEIMYSETPEVVLDYPPALQVVNTDKWEGWTPFKNGGVWYVSYNIETYLNLKPKGAADEASSSSTTLIIVIVVIVSVVALIAWLVMRGRGKRAEEV